MQQSNDELRQQNEHYKTQNQSLQQQGEQQRRQAQELTTEKQQHQQQIQELRRQNEYYRSQNQTPTWVVNRREINLSDKELGRGAYGWVKKLHLEAVK